MKSYATGNISNGQLELISKFELFLFIKTWNCYSKRIYKKPKDFKSCDGLKVFIKLYSFGHKAFTAANTNLMSNEQSK